MKLLHVKFPARSVPRVFRHLPLGLGYEVLKIPPTLYRRKTKSLRLYSSRVTHRASCVPFSLREFYSNCGFLHRIAKGWIFTAR